MIVKYYNKRIASFFLASIVLVCNISNTCAQKRKVDMLELPAYTTNIGEQIVFHKAYTVSFNAKHKIPSWVAWELTEQRCKGLVHRDGAIFDKDPEIGEKCPVPDYQYQTYRYARGHMCPAGDNKNDNQAMKECFYMTNMCPQKQILNNGTWKVLEEKCRIWTRFYGRIYIVCGPIIPKRVTKRVGPSQVTVPTLFFKAILREERGEYKVIGYMFNQNDHYWTATIDQIEEVTGLNLFHNLDEEIQRKIESKENNNEWLQWYLN